MKREVYSYYLITYANCNGVVHVQRCTALVSHGRVYSVATSSQGEAWS